MTSGAAIGVLITVGVGITVGLTVGVLITVGLTVGVAGAGGREADGSVMGLELTVGRAGDATRRDASTGFGGTTLESACCVTSGATDWDGGVLFRGWGALPGTNAGGEGGPVGNPESKLFASGGAAGCRF